jgi:NAD(P)-dependent dehydrogenase (short-subunit alcohol dehydrogenase family)
MFVQEGATVVIAARDEGKGNHTVREVQERTGKEIRFVRCDVSQESEVKNLVRQIMALYQRIDIWVNNGGPDQRP